MRGVRLQAFLLGLVAMALLAMPSARVHADPAARDRWESDDGEWKFTRNDEKSGKLWTWRVKLGTRPVGDLYERKRTDGLIVLGTTTKEVIYLTANKAEYESHSKEGGWK